MEIFVNELTYGKKMYFLLKILILDWERERNQNQTDSISLSLFVSFHALSFSLSAFCEEIERMSEWLGV